MERIAYVSSGASPSELPGLLERAGYDVLPGVAGESEAVTAAASGSALIVVDNRPNDIDIQAMLKPLGEPRPPLLVAVDEGNVSSPVLERASDIIVEPFGEQELVARVRLLLIRYQGHVQADGLRRGELLIDVANYKVTVAGDPLDLTFKEYELLKFLATNDGKVFTREALLNRVWGYDYYGGARTVDVHIRRIRSKIETGGRAFIETVRNVGYRFTAR
ncbi:MAG: DNA-binding response regulator [Dehalococcoidia bacterium]|nr:DNA-binding response regulator [Dehalococcoidia bacterium]